MAEDYASCLELLADEKTEEACEKIGSSMTDYAHNMSTKASDDKPAATLADILDMAEKTVRDNPTSPRIAEMQAKRAEMQARLDGLSDKERQCANPLLDGVAALFGALMQKSEHADD